MSFLELEELVAGDPAVLRLVSWLSLEPQRFLEPEEVDSAVLGQVGWSNLVQRLWLMV